MSIPPFSLPAELPGIEEFGLTEDEFHVIMYSLLTLQGALDQASEDLPENRKFLNAVIYYGRLAKSLGMRDQHALDMITVAAAAVVKLRSVVDSMLQDVITEAETAKYDD